MEYRYNITNFDEIKLRLCVTMTAKEWTGLRERLRETQNHVYHRTVDDFVGLINDLIDQAHLDLRGEIGGNK